MLISYNPFLVSPQSHVGCTIHAMLSAQRQGRTEAATCLAPAAPSTDWALQSGCRRISSSLCAMEKKRRQRGGQRADLHWEEEDEVGNRGKEEQNQRCRAGRKVNPAVSINHCRTERKSLQWCWDEAVQGAGSAPSVVSIHQCQQTDIPCSWIWSHLMPSLTPGAMAAYPSGSIFCSKAMCVPKGRDNLI